MKKVKVSFIILLFCAVFINCKDNSVDSSNNETLIYQYDGLIEDIGGDCSAVQVRIRSYGMFDLTSSDKVKFNFNGMSDADLSSINFYYIHSGEQIDLINLPHRDQINSTQTVEVDSPQLNTEIFSRVTLKSSVCTGQVFFLSLRDLKIYSITE